VKVVKFILTENVNFSQSKNEDEMLNFEKLGSFYLGKSYDLISKKITDNLTLYDSKDLTTHAMIVGMTGSGKTGLGISLLEEAAIDNIPSIIIDPKGDITNLLLTFPDLKPADFLPWINKSDAKNKGLSEEEFAKQQAALWKKGLAKWGQDGKRIKMLKESAEFNIYTPGSTAGKSISLLKSFEAPSDEFMEESDWFADRISTTTSGLLGLLGIDADPLTSKEHILISTILKFYWLKKENLSLTDLILSIQEPPVKKVGVFDVEKFYPAKERMKLAMLLNNLLSSPKFQSWLSGEPLSIDNLLYNQQGKPKVSIFYIAHLSENERMFFTSLLLNNILGWVRAQSGTTSLRALLYIDEIFGYLPPVANPPSKKPLLTLLKQARAFGLGVVLSTQNPVDLDYKSISNMGTWFIGRLQTKQDRERVIDGLTGASSESGNVFDKNTIEDLVSKLDKRVFLLHNVHERQPVIFHTRWAMSYLRGPLTRRQIKQLTKKESANVLKPVQSTETSSKNKISKPLIPKEIKQLFVPYRGIPSENEKLMYKPCLFGMAKVRFSNSRLNIDLTRDEYFTTPINDDIITVDWNKAEKFDLTLSDLLKKAESGIEFAYIPSAALNPKNYKVWMKEFKEFLYRASSIELLKSNMLKITSLPNENPRDFKIRLQQLAREKRDEQLDKLKKKFAKKLESLENKIRRAEERVAREESQTKQQKLQTAITFGATILGALFGSKAVSRSTIGRTTSTISKAGRILKESQDVQRAKENLEILLQKKAELQEAFQEEIELFKEKFDLSLEELEKIPLHPKKTDIQVQLVALLWCPVFVNTEGEQSKAW